MWIVFDSKASIFDPKLASRVRLWREKQKAATVACLTRDKYGIENDLYCHLGLR
jgi:hypothetical protein